MIQTSRIPKLDSLLAVFIVL